MKVAYFDCFSGASGDMLLGSLVDAGLDLDDLRADLALLGIGGYRLEAARVTRGGLTGTHFDVLIDEESHPARHLSSVEQIISRSRLPERVRRRSTAVFRRLARAEAQVHGVALDHVHFHELSAVDSLVDIVGFVCALERLGIEAAYSSALVTGSGLANTAHGRLPVPAPATLALLTEAHAPLRPSSAEAELLTPTGAVLLTEFASFQQPPMTIHSVGYGFGMRELPWPNAVRVWLGEAPADSQPGRAEQVVQITCNLDDATGESLGYAMERLLQAGALDVWFTPIQMKKNRPAVQLALLARTDDADRLAGLVLRETPTLGLRLQALNRRTAERDMRQVETAWGTVRLKVKILDGAVVSASPEYDDCARLAAEAGVPLAEVMAAARAAALP